VLNLNASSTAVWRVDGEGMVVQLITSATGYAGFGWLG